MKKFLIIGNWKLHGNLNFIKHSMQQLIFYIQNNKLLYSELSIAAPYTYLHYIYNNIPDKLFNISAQNVDIHTIGSYTGEISVYMLKDIGVKYVIIGHSERRLLHNENNEVIAHKLSLVKSVGLIPILCIGETLCEKNNNQTINICINQINTIIKKYSINFLKNIIIAYEPVWAIGSGIVPNICEIQKTITCLKQYIKKISIDIANSILFQYGGSVNFNNLDQFIHTKNIDGLLIGKASLDIDLFIKIIEKIDQKLIFIHRS
ncbi:triose-phosphate isomerase [Enterobacteriaceae endosymbiont of Macroplea appendiculata]|uniref:triose-phosphate isomerase n=1 Tax=Enterobacteriaceae endosymbiont of Macroplea appendiculata TaxID=2675790 RepID=UPI001448C12C|nr:triose-phosphate isomerase [Enterobacteriaceae endosymbiont of Macroplea appendiculata]QJC30809.1 triose-phosphate isomerase [Enterobacteriaceae endosymbiont of Macroplea appendiculata]